MMSRPSLYLVLRLIVVKTNKGTIKELLVLQFDDLRSTNKELFELGLGVDSL